MSACVEPPVVSSIGPRRGIDWFGDSRVVVVDLGLACCAIESEFAVPDQAREMAEVPEGSLVVCVLSGTLTDVLAPLVAAWVAQVRPDVTISFGACACAGGPYWDALPVTKGVDQIVDVDLYIPGCPPPPSALTEAIIQLVEARA